MPHDLPCLTKKNNAGRLTVPIWIAVYTLLFLVALVMDYFLYFANIPYWAALLLATIMVGSFAAYLVIKKILYFKFSAFYWADLLALAFISVMTLICIAFPDISFDTRNYHIFYQETLGRDAIGFDWFPTRSVNTMYYVLGDRLFGIFRYLFGYRLGVILNGFQLVVLYYQARDIFPCLTGMKAGANEGQTRSQKIWPSLGGLLVISAEHFPTYLSNYYVDALALPFMMEILRRLLEEKDQKVKDVIFVCLIAGISCCIKPNNAVFIGILAIWYIIRYIQQLSIIGVVGGLSAAFFTVFVYGIISYTTTGNPFFPYLNTIFKSPYFPPIGANEYIHYYDLWGPKTLLQWALWPIFLILGTRAGVLFTDGISQYSGRIGIAFIILIIFFVLLKLKRVNSGKMLPFGVFWVGIYCVHLVFYKGHLRYSLFLEAISGVLIVAVAALICSSLKIKHAPKTKRRIIAGAILVCTLAYNIVILGTFIILPSALYRQPTLVSSPSAWMKNASLIGRDHGVDASVLRELGVDAEAFLIYDNNAGNALLLNDKIPLIQISWGVTNDYTKDGLAERLREFNQEKLYTVSNQNDISGLLAAMKDNPGYCPDELYTITPFFINNQYRIELIKLRSAVLTYYSVAQINRYSQPILPLNPNELGENHVLFVSNSVSGQSMTQNSPAVSFSVKLEQGESKQEEVLYLGEWNGATQALKINLNFEGKVIEPQSRIIIETGYEPGDFPDDFGFIQAQFISYTEAS